jgi:glycosyltransferase involved in cell wall biosynthesis
MKESFPLSSVSRSSSHIILIPSYNTGADLLMRTVRGALSQWQPVWVVIDGSTDGSEEPLLRLAENEEGLRVLRLPRNGGKGGAVQAGTEAALQAGYTHALLMDADGQHPTSHIASFMTASKEAPDALVMGAPQFGPDAPAARLRGRKLTIWWTDLESGWAGLGDTLFGMRVYPLHELARIFRQTRWARGFDFDPEAAVRLFWAGCRPLQVPVPCRYLPKEEGGVSHFNYLRDNILLTWLHFRLVPELLLLRWPRVRRTKRSMRREADTSRAPSKANS